MDTNIAAWMIAGGPHIEIHGTERDRAQLHAYLESQRETAPERPSLVERLRSLGRPRAAEAVPACCPA
jgi:hypothetical protein